MPGAFFANFVLRLERNAQAELDFMTRRRRFGDRAKLRRVHEAVGRPEIGG
jgi:hypothetical protein